MSSQVKLTLYHANISRLTSKVTSESSRRAAEKTKKAIQSEIVASGRMDTGAMHRSIEVSPVAQSPEKSSFKVGSSKDYFKYQDQGIGPVTAKSGKVLAFSPKGMSATIFRPRTRGFPGAQFLRKARARLSVRDWLP